MANVKILADGVLGAEIESLIKKSGYVITSDSADVIVEAIIADKDRKRSALVDAASAPAALILTSTLNASATEVASWIDQPNRVVGWAMLPPIEKSKVVEVANPRGASQNLAGLDRAKVFFESLGKEAMTVNDAVGGVLPRVVAHLINGAAFAVMEGVASPRDIDQAMKLGTNYPRGPLEWGDTIGLDQVLGIMNALHEAYGERYRPAPLLVQMAQAKKKFYG